MLKRKGGINMLKTLAIESGGHIKECLYILCDLNEWMEDMSDEFFAYKSGRLWYERKIEPRRDKNRELISIETQSISKESLKAIASIIRIISKSNNRRRISFQDKSLCGLDLKNIREKVSYRFLFSKSDLRGANLENANLQGSYLSYTQLQGANLNNTQLQEIDLYQEELEAKMQSQAQQSAYFHEKHFNKLDYWSELEKADPILILNYKDPA